MTFSDVEVPASLKYDSPDLKQRDYVFLFLIPTAIE